MNYYVCTGPHRTTMLLYCAGDGEFVVVAMDLLVITISSDITDEDRLANYKMQIYENIE